MDFRRPSRRRLFITWVLLMGLTAATMFAGHAWLGGTQPLGVIWIAAIGLLTGVKAIQVLFNFLNLRASTSGWKALFIAFLFAIFAVVLLAYAITPLIAAR